MTTYVYCRRGSDSARSLSTLLGAVRVRNFDGLNFWRKNRRIKFVDDDVIIAWGDTVPDIPGVHVINGAAVGNKYVVAKDLEAAGVPTITAFNSNPCRKNRDGTDNSEDAKYFLRRNNNHIGGNDLLRPNPRPDYWVTRLNIASEYRIHSFNQKSIRAGEKRLREGFSTDAAAVAASAGALQLASDWVRSFDGGWRIVYDAFQSNKVMRELAHKAVKALNLTFGAVDLALTADGQLLVLEVNRAPGLEGGSIEAYAKNIKEWIDEARGIQSGSTAIGERVRRAGDTEGIVPDVTVFPAPERVAVAEPVAVAGQGPAVQQEQPAPANPGAILLRSYRDANNVTWEAFEGDMVAGVQQWRRRRAQAAVPQPRPAVQAVPDQVHGRPAVQPAVNARNVVAPAAAGPNVQRHAIRLDGNWHFPAPARANAARVIPEAAPVPPAAAMPRPVEAPERPRVNGGVPQGGAVAQANNRLDNAAPAIPNYVEFQQFIANHRRNVDRQIVRNLWFDNPPQQG